MPRSVLVKSLCALLMVIATSGSARAQGAIEVVVPDRDNLQFLLLWVALGAGHFEQAGVQPQLIVPERRRMAVAELQSRANACAVLPPPMYRGLLDEERPVWLVANLLARDPANLVLRAELAAAHEGADKATALRGRTIGVAHGPEPRLERALASVGLTLDDVAIEVIRGPDQNEALANGSVDAIFAHTPYLERALVRGAGVLWVAPARGEVPALDDLMIHMVVCNPGALDVHRREVKALVGALWRARALVRDEPEAALSALRSVLPDRDPEEMVELLELYAPALPDTLAPSAERLAASLPLFPDARAGAGAEPSNLAQFIDPTFAEGTESDGEDEEGPQVAWLLAGLAAGLVLALWIRSRRHPRPHT